MSTQLDFLFHQAIQYFQCGNLSGADLLLGQILKNRPTHSEALSLSGVIAAKQNNYELALELMSDALRANKRNGIAHSNMGNILLALNRTHEAIEAYRLAIKVMPTYAEAHGNLGNALQVCKRYSEAIEVYREAIKIDPHNAEFMVSLGNAYLRTNRTNLASAAYDVAIVNNPSNAKAHFFRALAQLQIKNFQEGWQEYEWRWASGELDSLPLRSSRPVWNGEKFEGSLLIWAEQGLGDQILYASIFSDLINFPQKIIISVNKKLLPIYQRSFPLFQVIDSNDLIPEESYDYHLPVASLGKFFRTQLVDFKRDAQGYLAPNPDLINVDSLRDCKKSILCGLSWKSSNENFGTEKSVGLMDLSEILMLDKLEFINLQYGNISSEIKVVKDQMGIDIISPKDINLHDELDKLLNLIKNCDVILTISNSTAHMAGALGKEVLLLLPYSVGAIWYWHDIESVSLWYPSVRIFKQEKQGDWSAPIKAAKAYLENRFAI